MWVQLLRSRQIETGGVSRMYHPGDCVDVGKQTAQRWVVDGAARFLTPQALDADLTGCGVALIGDMTLAGKLKTHAPSLEVEQGVTPSLPFARTLIWHTTFPLRPELVPLGFHLLERWEAAAPVASYDQLACHIGTEKARARTQAVVRDLRVPVYAPGLVFVKRGRAGRDLLDAWAQERESGDDDRLCLLRAIYRVKPLLCALPVTWNKGVSAIA